MTSPKERSFILSVDIRKTVLYVTGIVIRGTWPLLSATYPLNYADSKSWVIKASNSPQVERETNCQKEKQVERERLSAREKRERRLHSVTRPREPSQIKAS